jgi:hypothetical protein
MAARRQSFTSLTPSLLALSILAAGCAGDVRWTKADTDEETMARDMALCRKQAQVAYGGAAALAPTAPLDPRFGPTGPTPAERVMQESQAVGGCMRGKGYTLITVDKK